MAIAQRGGMRLTPAAIAQAAIVMLTALVLVATSRDPCTRNVPETQGFLVSGDCGPGGVIAITSSVTCTLSVDGGNAVQLPNRGTQPLLGPIRMQNVFLNSWLFGVDGGTVPLAD